MEFKKNFLICLTGLPASGKSTFAYKLKKRILNYQTKYEVIIIDPDKIREFLYNSLFSPEKEQIVRKKNLEKIEQILKENKIVISDDINYYSSMRHDLKEICERLNLKFYIIFISTPIKVCLEWNQIRDKSIPDELIVNIKKKFDKFHKYKWDRPNLIVDMSKVENIDKIILEFLDKIHNSQKNPIIELIERDKKKNYSKSYSESLDLITRSIVRELLINREYHHIKKDIFRKRREFIKKNLNKLISEAEIKRLFIEFLEFTLDIDIH